MRIVPRPLKYWKHIFYSFIIIIIIIIIIIVYMLYPALSKPEAYIPMQFAMTVQLENLICYSQLI